MCMRIPKGARDECATQMFLRDAGRLVGVDGSERGVFANGRSCSCSEKTCTRERAETATHEAGCFFPDDGATGNGNASSRADFRRDAAISTAGRFATRGFRADL